MNAIETIATTMANSRSIEPAVLITADSVFDTYKLVTSWMRSSTSVPVTVTVLGTVELLADVVFVKATPLLIIIFEVVNTTEVAAIVSRIC